MILVDTGALFALGAVNDTHHRDAAAFFRRARSHEHLVIPHPVLAEAALLIEARRGIDVVRVLWDDVLDGVFGILDVSDETLRLARAIDRRYVDANLGLVDAVSLALCEQHRIAKVFTFDRRHFGLYRPTFTESLTLLP